MQGAGRLIRKADDRGYLLVADNRVRGKAYGRRFLSLIDTYPLWEVGMDGVEGLLEPMERWS